MTKWRLSFPLLLLGCGDPKAVLLTLEGQVQSYVDQAPIDDALVSLYSADERFLGEGETDEDGAYSLTVPVPYTDAGAAFFGEVSHDAFVGTTFYQNVRLASPRESALAVTPGKRLDSTILYLSSVNLAPQSDETGMIGGRVFDALVADQALGVGGLELELREGVNPPDTDPVVDTVVTSGSGPEVSEFVGVFSFEDVPAGTYTAFIDGGEEYLDAHFPVVAVGGDVSDGQNGATTPVLEENQFRVVLAWGEHPEDLDAHLTGPIVPGMEMPDGSNRFHVAYWQPDYPVGTGSSAATVFLDVDDVTSYGPETMTVRDIHEGQYRYSIHDYTNRLETVSNTMSYSRATVQVFVGRDSFESFGIPTSRFGTVWTVFELDGEERLPFLVNSFAYEEDPSAIESF